MYTRHFYKEDEVVAALMYCTAFGRIQEAVFWAQELLDTNLGLQCLKTLFHSWLLFRGVGAIQWLEHCLNVWKSEDIEDDAILLLTYQLASLPLTTRDSTAITLTYLCLEDRKNKTPDRLLANGVNEDSEMDNWKKAIYRAAAQKKTEFLWLLLRKYWFEDEEMFWKLCFEVCREQDRHVAIKQLQEFSQLLDDAMLDYFIFAVAVGCIGLSEKQWKQSHQSLRQDLDDICKKLIENCKELLGRKERRKFTIPRDCLYWVTDRGQMNYKCSTLVEIPDLFLYLETSEYWFEALGEKSFEDLSELDKLSFLETYFPDGHLLSWSKDELAKSHGDGVLSPNETPSLQKWQRIWIRNTESRLIWKGWKRASNIELSIDYGLHDLYHERKDAWEEEYTSWNLEPVIKKLVPFQSDSS